MNEKIHNELINFLKSSNIHAIKFWKYFWFFEVFMFSFVLFSKTTTSISFIEIVLCRKWIWKCSSVLIHSLITKFFLFEYFSNICTSFRNVKQWLKWYINFHVIFNIISHARQFRFMFEIDFNEVIDNKKKLKKY